jgi:hypothetical protein
MPFSLKKSALKKMKSLCKNGPINRQYSSTSDFKKSRNNKSNSNSFWSYFTDRKSLRPKSKKNYSKEDVR